MNCDQSLHQRFFLNAPPQKVFRWHARTGAFRRLTPPWQPIQEHREPHPLTVNAISDFTLYAFGRIPMRWVSRFTEVTEPVRFTDEGVDTPFAQWNHVHEFHTNNDGTDVVDQITFRLPLAPFSHPMLKQVRNDLHKALAYRERILAHDLAEPPVPPQTIVMTGPSGMVGRALIPFLTTQGHTVIPLSRNPKKVTHWNPDTGAFLCDLTAADTVIHLAGEPIGEGLWTPAKMKRIIESRVRGTKLLAEKIAAMKHPPKTLICASAIGYYGDRGDELLTEEACSGNNFTAEVCTLWEQAARPAIEKGVRVVFLRIGVALTPAGGALKKFLAPFRAGFGTVLGSGNQFLSWVSMEDILGAVHHTMRTESLEGAVNVVSPEATTHTLFSETLGKILNRSVRFSLPSSLISLLLGRSGRELLLSSTRAYPKKLLASGYAFRYASLEEAIRHTTGIYPD